MLCHFRMFLLPGFITGLLLIYRIIIKKYKHTRIFFYKKLVYKKPDAGASKRLRNFQY